MVLFIRNKKLEKNDIERAERASQNICTFASEKCFTYRPETREKAINDCDLRASHFFCVCLKHAILLNIVLVNHIVCRYNVSLCS